MRHNFLLLLLLSYSLISQSESYSQKLIVSLIKGHVYDIESNKPLENVNVYVAGTQIGTSTNEEGYFEFPLMRSGSYDLIFSYVSYRAQIKNIRIIRPTEFKFEIKLQPVPVSLGEVRVKAERDTEWEDNFKIFVKEFIGLTNNGSSTKILNPYIISFDTKWDGTFTARADEPLQIINEALGYKLTYILEYFEYGVDYVKFDGVPAFEEIPPKSEEQCIVQSRFLLVLLMKNFQ